MLDKDDYLMTVLTTCVESEKTPLPPKDNVKEPVELPFHNPFSVFHLLH